MVTIAAVGDVLLSGAIQRGAARASDGFAGLFRQVHALVSAADIAYANLEGPAADGVALGGRYVGPAKTLDDPKVFGGYPAFNYHPAIVTELQRAGFDVLGTANNHAIDRGPLGIDGTIEAIRNVGILHTGTRRQAEPEAPWHTVSRKVTRSGEVAIAWLGCTYDTNGVPDPHRQVLRCFSDRAIVHSYVDSLARSAGIHAVIVVPHWGTEYADHPDTAQIQWAREMLDAGATAVIGHHVHVVQRMERVVTADGREALVAYSLGNFVSSQIGLERRTAAMLALVLAPHGDGRLGVAAVGWVPLSMSTEGGAHVKPMALGGSAETMASSAHLLTYLPSGNVLPPTPEWPLLLKSRAASSGQERPERCAGR